MIPYEDYLDSPSVTAVGYRPLNAEENNRLDEEEYIESLATEKGISYYEAAQLKNLRDKGVV